ncbi:hypothetical protein [Mesorhizobium sp. M0220]|uniref:hypothetical protein n=1 Tax=Mesorhizobium sp. M0220 TaxID=2956920 RepID=UPI003335FA72
MNIGQAAKASGVSAKMIATMSKPVLFRLPGLFGHGRHVLLPTSHYVTLSEILNTVNVTSRFADSL